MNDVINQDGLKTWNWKHLTYNQTSNHGGMFLQNKDFYRRFAIKQKYSGQRNVFLEIFVVSVKTLEWSVWVSNEKYTYFFIMVEELWGF